MPENGNVQTPNKSQVYMSRFSSLLCSLLFCMITYAQEITVTGKVTAGGEEMPGVTVAVKGQTRGTITSIDGSYQIQVNGNESLIFSFVGYETVTIPVNRRKVINVELKETTQMVDEVVITVPYGTAKIHIYRVCKLYCRRYY